MGTLPNRDTLLPPPQLAKSLHNFLYILRVGGGGSKMVDHKLKSGMGQRS